MPSAVNVPRTVDTTVELKAINRLFRAAAKRSRLCSSFEYHSSDNPVRRATVRVSLNENTIRIRIGTYRKANRAKAARTPGKVRGSMTCRNARLRLAPRSEAASIKVRSNFSIEAYIGRTAKGK